jgi:hypothetical protein
MAVWADDLLGYGKPKSDWSWWLDLEEVDGEIRKPDFSQKNLGEKR